MSDASVELCALTRAFGDNVAVDGLSLTVASGELFGIVGPDGAGKTTTLRMLAGVLRPSGGTAVVAGTDVDNDFTICDIGEACGGYPTRDDIQPVTIRKNKKKMDFLTGYAPNLEAGPASVSSSRATTFRRR